MTSDTCRLTVVAPTGWVELAVPSDIAVADLLPVLVRHGGEPLAEAGVDEGGWVLQRLGGPALDPDGTPDALGLHDGDTLYLRARDAELPVLEFDDAIDGVATGIRRRPHRWRETTTRYAALAGMTTAIATLIPVLLIGGPALTRAVTAAVVALLLVVAAAATSRAYSESTGALLLGICALPFALLAGVLFVPSAHASWTSVSAPQLLAGSTAAAATAVLVMLGARVALPLFVALGTVCAAGAVAALIGTTAGLSAAKCAAIVVMLTLMLSPSAPITAFRLARLDLPMLPRTPEELQQDIDPHPSGLLLDRVALADQFQTGLLAATAAICAGCLAPLAHAPGWAPKAAAVVAVLALLLRSRLMTATWPRVITAAAGGYGLVLLLLGFAASLPPGVRLQLFTAALLLGGGLLLTAARILPGRRVRPTWGRAAEILESLVSFSLPALVLAILGVYGYARGLAG